MARIRIASVILLVWSFVSSGAVPTSFEGRLKSVSSGDTVTVLVHGRSALVRLSDVWCPRPDQPYFRSAKRFTYDAAFDKTVTVEVVRQEPNGAFIGRVRLPGGRSLSEALVKEGWAWWDRRAAPDDRRLERLERKAREAKRGLWADDRPVAPWVGLKKK